MSLVTLGKRLHRTAVQAVCPTRIVFHHVPKCGGTSVGRALRRAYILSQGTVTPEESYKAVAAFIGDSDRARVTRDVRKLREMMLLYLLYSDVRCIAAHIPFSDAAREIFAPTYAFVTLLRDPVVRFISHFKWSHGRPSAPDSITDDFEDFLGSERAREIGATYVRYFGGRAVFQATTERAKVDAAIANLRRLSYVGFLDQVDDFEAALRRITGKRVRIGHENAGVGNKITDRLAELGIRKRVLEACAPDRDIWAAVQDLRHRPLAEPQGLPLSESA